MDKEHSSRRINYYTGGSPDEMFCSRCHRERKLYGGLWIPLSASIDICFYVIRRQSQHVRATYLLQRRRDAQSYQRANRAPQEEAGTQQANPPRLEDVLPTGDPAIQRRVR